MSKLITSNRGRHTYTLTRTVLASHDGYTLLRRDICSVVLPADMPIIHPSGSIDQTNVSLLYGRLRIGCRIFNLATTKILLRWKDTSRVY